MPKWTLMESEAFYFLKALGFQALIWTQARAETTRTWQLFQRGLGPSNTSCPAIRTKTPTEQTQHQQNGCISVFSCVFSKKSFTTTRFVSPMVYPPSLKPKDMAQCKKSDLIAWVLGWYNQEEQGSDRPPASALVCACQRRGEERGRTFCSQVIIG